MLYPFYYMISTSLHSSDQYQLGSGGYSLASWRNLFDVLPGWRQLLNSTIVSAGGIAIILFVSTTRGPPLPAPHYPGGALAVPLLGGAVVGAPPSIIPPR